VYITVRQKSVGLA